MTDSWAFLRAQQAWDDALPPGSEDDDIEDDGLDPDSRWEARFDAYPYEDLIYDIDDWRDTP